jgi:hypothetical protein
MGRDGALDHPGNPNLAWAGPAAGQAPPENG